MQRDDSITMTPDDSAKNVKNDALLVALNGEFEDAEEQLKEFDKILSSDKYRQLLARNSNKKKNSKTKKQHSKYEDVNEITTTEIKEPYQNLIDEVVYKHFFYAYKLLLDLKLPENFFSIANDKTRLPEEENYFKFVDHHVRQEILSQSTERGRAIAYEKWIAVMVRSLELGNHTTVQALLGPLRSQTIERLDITISPHAKKIFELFVEIGGKVCKSPFFNLTQQRAEYINGSGQYNDNITVPIQSLMGLIILNDNNLTIAQDEEWNFKYKSLVELLCKLTLINANYESTIAAYRNLLSRIVFKQKKEAYRKQLKENNNQFKENEKVTEKHWSDETPEDKELPDIILNAENKFMIFLEFMQNNNILSAKVVNVDSRKQEQYQKKLIKFLFELEELYLIARDSNQINEKFFSDYKKLADNLILLSTELPVLILKKESTYVGDEAVINTYKQSVKANEEIYKPFKEGRERTRKEYNILLKRLQNLFSQRLEQNSTYQPNFCNFDESLTDEKLDEKSKEIKEIKKLKLQNRELIDKGDDTESLFIEPFASLILCKDRTKKIQELIEEYIGDCKVKDEEIIPSLRECIIIFSKEEKEKLKLKTIFEKNPGHTEGATKNLFEVTPGLHAELSEEGKHISCLQAMEKMQMMMDAIFEKVSGPNLIETLNAIIRLLIYIRQNNNIYVEYCKYVDKKIQAKKDILLKKSEEDLEKYNQDKNNAEKSKATKQQYKTSKKAYIDYCKKTKKSLKAQIKDLKEIYEKLVGNVDQWSNTNYHVFEKELQMLMLTKRLNQKASKVSFERIEEQILKEANAEKNETPKSRGLSIIDSREGSCGEDSKNKDLITSMHDDLKEENKELINAEKPTKVKINELHLFLSSREHSSSNISNASEGSASSLNSPSSDNSSLSGNSSSRLSSPGSPYSNRPILTRMSSTSSLRNTISPRAYSKSIDSTSSNEEQLTSQTITSRPKSPTVRLNKTISIFESTGNVTQTDDGKKRVTRSNKAGIISREEVGKLKNSDDIVPGKKKS